MRNDLPMQRMYKLFSVIIVAMVVFALVGGLLGGFKFVVVSLVVWPFLAALWLLQLYRQPAIVFFHPTYFMVKKHIGRESKIAPEDVTEVTDGGWLLPGCHFLKYTKPNGRLWGYVFTSEVTLQLLERYPEIASKVRP